MTAYRVLKNTERAGNVLLGAGCYAAVLQHRTRRNKVIKIGNSATDAWGDYFDYIISALPDNPHVPRVDNMYVDYDRDYYVANMERLYTDANSSFAQDGDDDDFDMCLKNELVEDMNQYITGEISWKEFKRTWKQYPELVHLKSMRQLLDRITYYSDAITHEDEEELRHSSNYTDEELEGFRKLDLHGGNVMFRGNTIVITDPWCDLFVDEHSSMEEYIDQPERSNHDFNMTRYGEG